MASLERTKTSLTNNERQMIVSAHQYFLDDRTRTKQREHLPLHKQVAEAFGIGEVTVVRVVSNWNHRNDEQFTPP